MDAFCKDKRLGQRKQKQKRRGGQSNLKLASGSILMKRKRERLVATISGWLSSEDK